MSVFVLLSTLSVAFYVFLLVALYRDNRSRRRNRVELWEELEIGEGGRLVSAPKELLANSHPATSSKCATWVPVTKVVWKPVKQGGVTSSHSAAAILVSREQ